MNMYYIYIYNGGALCRAIYKILICYMYAVKDWLLIYNIYTMVDTCAYICIFVIITTHNTLHILPKVKPSPLYHYYQIPYIIPISPNFF